MRLTITLLNVVALILFTNEGDVMNKQIVAIFMTLVMIGTIFVIAPSDLQVEASGGGGGNTELDLGFIYNVTSELSDIGENNKKGRAFDTFGERYAANKIRDWMIDDCGLGSDNVEKDKIKNLNYPFRRLLFHNQPLASKLEVVTQSITIRNTSSNDTYTLDNDSWEFCIRPLWKDSCIDIIDGKYNFNHDSLTGTFNFTNLSVIPRIGGIPSMGNNFSTMLDEIKEGYLLLPKNRFSSNT